MISGIILAAGASKRMGFPKQTINLGGKPMLQHVVDTFLASSLDEVILVVPPFIRWKARRKRLRVVVNPRSAEGISTSLRIGVESIDPRSDAALVGLGDKPLLRKSTIEKLIAAHGTFDSEILVPVFRGNRGNPILFRRRLFREMTRLKGDVGAKVLVKRKKRSVAEVPVEDVGILIDVDTPPDLRKASGILSARARLAEGKSRK